MMTMGVKARILQGDAVTSGKAARENHMVAASFSDGTAVVAVADKA
jgi:hypothetical protein